MTCNTPQLSATLVGAATRREAIVQSRRVAVLQETK